MQQRLIYCAHTGQRHALLCEAWKEARIVYTGSSPIRTVYVRNTRSLSVCVCVCRCIPDFPPRQCLEKTSQGNLRLPKTKFPGFSPADFVRVWSALARHVLSTSPSPPPFSPETSRSAGEMGVVSLAHVFVFSERGSRFRALKFSRFFHT